LTVQFSEFDITINWTVFKMENI